MMRIILALMGLLLVVAPWAQPAAAEATRTRVSFNCAAASSAVEHLICASPMLSVEDGVLALAYTWARHRATHSDAQTDAQTASHTGSSTDAQPGALLDSQRRWLKSRGEVCALSGKQIPPSDFERFRASVCLFKLYEARIHDLRDQPGAVFGPTGRIVTEELGADRAGPLVEGLRQSLTSLDAAAVSRASCSPVVTYMETGISGHDSSYGAACVLEIQGRSIDVMLCDDVLVGKFHVAQSQAGSPSTGELVGFIAGNCPPGG